MKKTLIVLTTCLLTSCVTEKSMIKNYSDLDFTVSVDKKYHQKNGVLPFQIKVHFPAKYFHNKAYFDLHSYFEINGKKYPHSPFLTLNGEKVQDCNRVVPTKKASYCKYIDTLDTDEAGTYTLYFSAKINDIEMPVKKLISFRK